MDELHKLDNEVMRRVCVENLAQNLKTIELHSPQKGFQTMCYVLADRLEVKKAR